MAERKYPSRTRNKLQNALDGVNEPTSAVTNALSKANAKRAVTKRIPALTISRTFGPKSPIIQTDLQEFLAKCMSFDQWSKYTEQEKQGILNSLPDAYRPRQTLGATGQSSGREQLRDPPVNQQFCEKDKVLKQAIARFKRDLGDGYYEKVWLNKAKQAHQDRLEGKFDEYIRQQAAEMFVNDGEEPDESIDDTDDGLYEGPNSGRSRKARKT